MAIDDPGVAGLEADRAALDAVVEDVDTDGPPPAVAVISPPFGGRDAVVDYVVDRVDGPVDRRRLRSPVDPDSVPAIPTDHPFVLEDCHYLYRRRIDGFAPLDEFLDRLARREVPAVTGWNWYAWDYCRAVRDVGELFTRTVEVGPLDTDGVEAVVLDRCDSPKFVDRDESSRIRAVSMANASLTLPGGRFVEIPYPRPNRAWLAVWLRRTEEPSLETEVFEKLRRRSNGNPGVATAIFERSVRDGEIAPSDVLDPPRDLELGDDAAFLLWIVVATEAVTRETLSEVMADDRHVAVQLERLRTRGLVTVEGDTVSPTPESLPAVTGELERKGLLW
jgi:hypothetical protein